MPIVLDEIDRFAWDLGHVECPEHASDSQPDLTLCDDHARTDAAPGEGRHVLAGFAIKEVVDEGEMRGLVIYPAPKVQ